VPYEVRLRQVALVAAELAPAAEALQEALGLGDPFHDPGVAEFGLDNAVFAVGDSFLEIVRASAEGITEVAITLPGGGRSGEVCGVTLRRRDLR
jgi:hypothetical protein